MAFDLRQVEVAAAAAVVVEEVEAEVEQARRDRCAVESRASPPGASRAAARAAWRSARSADTASRPVSKVIVRWIASVRLIWPSMKFCQVGEFASSKSAMKTARAGVERVDHHLPVDRTGDLDAPVLQLVRHRSDAPVALADVRRLGRKSGSSPPRRRSVRAARAARCSRRRGPNSRSSSVRNSIASGASTASASMRRSLRETTSRSDRTFSSRVSRPPG